MGYKRIILITGDVETLGYFSRELAVYLHETGREVFIWDVLHPADSITAFEALPDKSDSVLVTFNFIGLTGEGQFGDASSTIWEEYGIDIINIMVDSPIYYYPLLSRGIKRLSIVCIDRNHVSYVRRWHPGIENVYFMPLCGNELINEMIPAPGIYAGQLSRVKPSGLPLSGREHKLLFIANYVTPDGIKKAIENADREYQEFLYDICDRMIKKPQLVLEDTLYECLKEAFPDEPDRAFPEAMHHCIFVDLYVRSHFRAQQVRALADAGIQVHCIGKDWDKLECRHPENLIHSGRMMTSADCVRALDDAVISLNVMPHFKDGAHDRIFSSMLAGCVSLTDPSAYLDEVITPWEDYAPYELGNTDSITDAAIRIMNDPDLAQYIADTGMLKARNGFTWKSFAESIVAVI